MTSWLPTKGLDMDTLTVIGLILLGVATVAWCAGWDRPVSREEWAKWNS